MRTPLKRVLLRVRRRRAGYRDGIAGRPAACHEEAYQYGWRQGRAARERARQSLGHPAGGP